MRDLFPGYYQPTEEEFAELWKECIFSFDTNVLLHIYRYSPKTRERLFDILQKLQKRIWITHHVGCEYHKNRLDVISQQLKAYDKIGKVLEDNLKIEKIGSLKKDLEIYKKHPLIDVKEIILTIETAIKEVITTVKNDLQKSKEKHPELIKNDEFHEQIIDVFNGRIGNNQDKLKDIYNWAEERFKYSIPPGYEDASRKPVPDKYGDAIIWFQLINYAKSEKKPIIFVTDDDKEDWWLKGDGKTISPRPELVQEMLAEAGVQFYMYSTDRFMKYAENFLKLPEQPESIEEAREIMIQEAATQDLSDIFEEVRVSSNFDIAVSEYSFQEQAQSIAEMTKFNSTITEQLRSITEMTKLNSAITEQLRSITEMTKIPSPFTDQLRSITEMTKISSPFTEQLRSITEMTKISSPFTEQLRSITEMTKISSP
ncbi:PIN-like domain-containing protein, partial [Nostoc sp.]|uniref:PIN-like domain-containing protein n=1 Tax=Nostoc sp. TaxID=1180 RepID=UPI002FF738BB